MSLVAKLVGTPGNSNLSRRDFLWDVAEDISVAGLAFLAESGRALAKEPNRVLTIDSIQAIKDLEMLLREFDEYYVSNSQFGKELKTIFTKTPAPIEISFGGFSQIMVKDGKFYVPQSHAAVIIEYSSFTNVIRNFHRNPLLNLMMLLGGVPTNPMFRLHEALHALQSNYNFKHNYPSVAEFRDTLMKHGMMWGYIKERDAVGIVLYDPFGSRIPLTFGTISHPNVQYSAQVQPKLSAFFKDLWKDIRTIEETEKRIYKVCKDYLENEANRSIIFEAHSNYVASVQNIYERKIGVVDIAKHAVNNHGVIGDEHFAQMVSAVNLIDRAYASLLNSGLQEMKKHEMVAELVGRGENTYNLKSGKYEGIEAEITEWERKYGTAPISQLNVRRIAQTLSIIAETQSLFVKFLNDKGYSSLRALEIVMYPG